MSVFHFKIICRKNKTDVSDSEVEGAISDVYLIKEIIENHTRKIENEEVGEKWDIVRAQSFITSVQTTTGTNVVQSF